MKTVSHLGVCLLFFFLIPVFSVSAVSECNLEGGHPVRGVFEPSNIAAALNEYEVDEKNLGVFERIERQIEQCNYEADRQIQNLQQNIRQHNATLQQLVTFAQIKDIRQQIANLKKSLTGIREKFREEAAKLTHSALYGAHVRYSKRGINFTDLLGDIKRAIAPQALEYLKGVHLRSVQTASRQNGFGETVIQTVKGAVDIRNQPLLEKKELSNKEFFFAAVFHNTEAQVQSPTGEKISGAEITVFNLCDPNPTDPKPPEQLQETAREHCPKLAQLRNDEKNKMETLVYQTGENINKVQQDIKIGQIQLQGQEKSASSALKRAGYVCKKEITQCLAAAEPFLKKKINTALEQIEARESLKLYYKRQTVSIGEDIVGELSEKLAGIARQLVETHGKTVTVHDVLAVTTQKSGGQTSVSSAEQKKRGYAIKKKPDLLRVFTLPGENQYHTLSVLSFKTGKGKIIPLKPEPKTSKKSVRKTTEPLPEKKTKKNSKKVSKKSSRQTPDGMVFIKGGYFQMGSPSNEKGRDGDEKQHRVYVDDFYMGKYEVTVGEFRRFVKATGHRTTAEKGKGCRFYDGNNWKWDSSKNWENPGFRQTESHPVVCVSWLDALAYVQWLSRESGETYRLPTEAEWEYVARGGTTTRFYWGDDPGYREICDYANVNDKTSKRVNDFYWDNADCDDGYANTAPVGKFKPNAYGLYDMSGNVWEWTCTEWNSSYEGQELECNNRANDSSARVFRGGSWSSFPRYARSAYPVNNGPSLTYNSYGFRVSRSP